MEVVYLQSKGGGISGGIASDESCVLPSRRGGGVGVLYVESCKIHFKAEHFHFINSIL